MGIITDNPEGCTFRAEGIHCGEIYNCCDCGGYDCGCGYCWSCNACEYCITEEEER